VAHKELLSQTNPISLSFEECMMAVLWLHMHMDPGKDAGKDDASRKNNRVSNAFSPHFTIEEHWGMALLQYALFFCWKWALHVFLLQLFATPCKPKRILCELAQHHWHKKDGSSPSVNPGQMHTHTHTHTHAHTHTHIRKNKRCLLYSCTQQPPSMSVCMVVSLSIKIATYFFCGFWKFAFSPKNLEKLSSTKPKDYTADEGESMLSSLIVLTRHALLLTT
jgi:hypothetical protein